MLELRPVNPGDRVAVLSPSAGLAARFPEPFDLGLKRIREVLNLEPVEFPTTRQLNASTEARAQDLMAAFADPSISAVFSAIGGSDQVRTLRHLNKDVFRNNPKPFFGYSDNTHIHNFLWQLGIPSYYGGAVMTQLGMQHSMFDVTVESFKTALFKGGEVELKPSPIYNDIGLSWANPDNINKRRVTEPNQGWFWDGSTNAEGMLWGGCLESMIIVMGSGRWTPSSEALRNTVLYLETAEDIPPPDIVDHVLATMGERGWLENMSGLLMGRPKAWEFDNQKTAEQKAEFRAAQREAVVNVVREYNATMPIVQNLDFGHTDPQFLIPSGRKLTIDGQNQRLIANYGPQRQIEMNPDEPGAQHLAF